MKTLTDYGWSDFFAEALESSALPGTVPARVIGANSGELRLIAEDGPLRAAMAGRIRHRADSSADSPAVGDWVQVRADQAGARVEGRLPRRTKLSRKVAGKRQLEQVVAANVDRALVVMGLDGDFNLRRLERFLTVIWESGARPLVLLNKVDLCDDPTARLSEVQSIVADVPVGLASCKHEQGLEQVVEWLPPRETAVLLGSSGVGKSSLINRLLGESVQKVREVREGDDRGRHTTTGRELFRLPNGALLIDNPGVRELQLWGGEESLGQAFADIETLAADCRFRDCAHEAEVGCAVRTAVEGDVLSPERLASFKSLQKELRYLAQREDQSAQQVQKHKWRAIHREMRRSNKHRKR